VIKGLLLDFYGTVVEEDDEVVAHICAEVAATGDQRATAAAVSEAWWRDFVRAADTAPFRPQRQLAVDSLARVIAHFGSAADPRELCAPQFAYWQAPPLRPGSREFLDRLSIPVCLLSDIDRADLDAATAYHGLSFTATVSSEDVGAYKPDPAMFRRGLDALGLAASEVLHIGDSLAADVAGARAAGIRVAWVNRKARPIPPDLGAAFVVRDLIELGTTIPELR
jgi:2-haloacid dehalogenase/putative hydrolase of the HAD superfamily